MLVGRHWILTYSRESRSRLSPHPEAEPTTLEETPRDSGPTNTTLLSPLVTDPQPRRVLGASWALVSICRALAPVSDSEPNTAREGPVREGASAVDFPIHEEEDRRANQSFNLCNEILEQTALLPCLDPQQEALRSGSPTSPSPRASGTGVPEQPNAAKPPRPTPSCSTLCFSFYYVFSFSH